MYTVNVLDPADEKMAWLHNHFDDFADADAWAHKAQQEAASAHTIGIWLDEGEGMFLYALVYDGITYVRWPG